jgi:hypothetical protein
MKEMERNGMDRNIRYPTHTPWINWMALMVALNKGLMEKFEVI